MSKLKKSDTNKDFTIITTDLPGMKNVKVMVSPPTIIKENSSKPVKR